MPRLGIVTGLAFEAETACAVSERASATVVCAAVDIARAEAAARQLIQDGCAALVSFGVAGGLDPHLKPGCVVVAESVVTMGSGRWTADERWRRRIAARLAETMEVTEAPLLGVDAPVTGLLEKQMQRARTGAAAVDMESHAVAAAATRAGRPFIVLRVVADPATRTVPAWLCTATDQYGRAKVFAAFAGLFVRPADAGVVVRLAVDLWAARRALRRAAFLVAPLFLFDA